MKLICLNVGLFLENNDSLSKFLKAEKPDMVLLQEVAREADLEVSPSYITKPIIDKALLKLKHSFFAPMWVIRDFRKKDFHGADTFHIDFKGFLEQGYYYRGAYHIYQGKNIFLLNEYRYQTVWGAWPDDDSRSIQVIDLIVGEGEKPNLRLMNYHGIWSRDKRGNQHTLEANKKILKIAKEVSYPVIICGDFNLFPDTKEMKLFDKDFTSLVNKYDIQSTRPETNELENTGRNVVDHVLISRGVQVNSFNVVKNNVSDHLPLILDFDLS